MKRLFCVFVLALIIPAMSLAVTEGVVEAAPQVTLEEMNKTDAPSYLPDGSYYAGYGDWLPAWENAQEWVESRFDGECYHDVEQRPRMTAGESARAKALLEAYQKGETAYTGESVLDKMEDVIVGVYALDLDDYDGERTFVILPGPCMTDEQILAVIDAYAQLGLTFDPDQLSFRNCARGGGIETSRFLTEEEGERYRSISRLIERGLLDVYGASVSVVKRPKLDSRYFCGLPDFSIRPYRRLTDGELAAALVEMGVHDLTGETDFAGTEKLARSVLCDRLGAPLSMTLTQIFTEGSYAPMLFDLEGNKGWDWNAEGRRCYGADFTFHTPEDILVYAHAAFDWETKALVSASLMHDKPDDGNVWPEENAALTQAQIDAAVRDAEAQLGLASLVWYTKPEEKTWTNWGECVCAWAELEQGLWLTIYIGTDDGQVHGMALDSGKTVETLPEDNMPVNG